MRGILAVAALTAAACGASSSQGSDGDVADGDAAAVTSAGPEIHLVADPKSGEATASGAFVAGRVGSVKYSFRVQKSADLNVDVAAATGCSPILLLISVPGMFSGHTIKVTPDKLNSGAPNTTQISFSTDHGPGTFNALPADGLVHMTVTTEANLAAAKSHTPPPDACKFSVQADNPEI
jgi:hypothetical protein